MSRNLANAISACELATTADPVCGRSGAEAAGSGSRGVFSTWQDAVGMRDLGLGESPRSVHDR